MAKTLTAREIRFVRESVTGNGIEVELEPKDRPAFRRWFFLLLAGIFIISVYVSERIFYAGLLDKTIFTGQWWRLFTHIFLHGGWLHLIMNGLALLVFAKVCEMHFGRRGWLTIFLVAGVTGGLAEMIFRPELKVVGASGGLMGLWGAQVAAALRLREVPRSFRQLSNQLALGSLVTWFGVQMVLDHLIPNIAWLAHLGGFLGGLAIAFVLPLNGRSAVFASRRGIARVKSLIVHDVKGTTDKDHYRLVEIALSESFDAANDFVVVKRDRLGFLDRHFVVYDTIAGTMTNTDCSGWQLIASPLQADEIGDPQAVIQATEKAEAEAKAQAAAAR